jgi:predicted lipid-binding transport protein (Tim44 family)
MRRSFDYRGSCVGLVTRWLPLLLVVLACVLVCAGDADARVGGGGSFSGGGGGGGFSGGGGGFSGGGGGSYSGGGGGGGGKLSWPWCIFIFVVFVVSSLIKAFTKQSNTSQPYSSTHTGERPSMRAEGRQRSGKTIRRRLGQLRQYDPNFSEILFMDFAYALYARVQEARGRGDLDTYKPYLAGAALKSLAGLGGGLRDEVREFIRKQGGVEPLQPKFDVRGVIVGAAQIRKVTDPQRDTISISVGFETNYTEAYGQGDGQRENTFYCEEVWWFTRRRHVLSPPPEKIRALGCANVNLVGLCQQVCKSRTIGGHLVVVHRHGASGS